MKEKVERMDEELNLTKKNLEFVTMELSFMKMFLANKFSIPLEDMSYG